MNRTADGTTNLSGIQIVGMLSCYITKTKKKIDPWPMGQAMTTVTGDSVVSHVIQVSF
jgi:hypothetical protein